MVRDLDDLILMACIEKLLYSKIKRLDFQDLVAFASNVTTMKIVEGAIALASVAIEATED